MFQRYIFSVERRNYQFTTLTLEHGQWKSMVGNARRKFVTTSHKLLLNAVCVCPDTGDQIVTLFQELSTFEEDESSLQVTTTRLGRIGAHRI